MKRHCRIPSVVAVVLLTAAIALLAGESPNYRSTPEVLDNGGGKSASAESESRASIGQPAVGVSRSANYILHAGYLYGACAHLSPGTSKGMAIARLGGLKPIIPEKDWKKLDAAIADLQGSLNPLWWIDAWHLNQEEEKKVAGGPGSAAQVGLENLSLGAHESGLSASAHAGRTVTRVLNESVEGLTSEIVSKESGQTLWEGDAAGALMVGERRTAGSPKRYHGEAVSDLSSDPLFQGESPTLSDGGEEGPVMLGGELCGEQVFKFEKGAAKKVKELIYKKYSPEIVEELVAVAVDIMDADSVLAQVKIVEAEISGGDPHELRKAREEMEKAEREKAKEKPEYGQVVHFYGKAWEHAVNAEKKGGGLGGVQVASLGQRVPVFALGKPYPNPSRSGSSVRFGIAEKCEVSLRVYDISGRLVRTLVSEKRSPGYYASDWDFRDGEGMAVSSGTYIYRLVAGHFVGRSKVVVVR
jgi:hypothetical protein